jgi:hypothetical protein
VARVASCAHRGGHWECEDVEALVELSARKMRLHSAAAPHWGCSRSRSNGSASRRQAALGILLLLRGRLPVWDDRCRPLFNSASSCLS